MKPSILITGGAGYIGSHTAFLMAQQGYNVLILDTFLHGQQFAPHWATVIKKDFSDKKTLDEIFTTYDIQGVMHFAALIEVGRSVTDPAAFYENNVSKTLVLLQSMLEHNVKKFIFSSSCAVYGIPQTPTLKEDHPKNPISPYGTTKLMVEHILHDFSKAYGLQYIALRYFNAAGALPEFELKEQHEPETHIIPLLLKCLEKGKTFNIFGADHPTPDGTCIRDYLHVFDIAKAHMLSFEKLSNLTPSDCYNLGTGNGYSVYQIIQEAQKIVGKQAKIMIVEPRSGDPAYLVANPGKAFEKLGWRPERSDLEYILRTAWGQNIVFVKNDQEKSPAL